MVTSKLSFLITPSDPTRPLGFEAWLDGVKFYDADHVSDTVDIVHEFSDEDMRHCLELKLKNKTSNHTTIDKNGNIESDSVLSIPGLSFDNIALGQSFNDLATYTHDFNGSGAPVTEKFYGIMGCNGTVELQFTTPIYLWLSEISN